MDKKLKVILGVAMIFFSVIIWFFQPLSTFDTISDEISSQLNIIIALLIVIAFNTLPNAD